MVGLLARLQCYFEPLLLLSFSIVWLPITLLFHPLLAITSPSAFRSKWFENMWRQLGPTMAASPLQVDHIEDLLSRAHGVVLELGPGGGDQMYHYKAGQIDKMYGAEPNVFLHDKLVTKAEEAGLGRKYIPLEAAAQPEILLPALKRAGLISSKTSSLPEDGIFDSIVAIKCLCSAPQNQMPVTLAVIQKLLKPGGEFLFFEHLGNNSDSITIAFARLVNLVWPYFMGGCRLDGKLDKFVLGMGGWDERTLTTTGEFHGHEPFRYVKGICRKA